GLMIKTGKIFSVILHGPPGCGKTALSNVMAEHMDAYIEKINAVSSGIKEIRKIAEKAKRRLASANKKTFLVIDEFHRFSRVQQEALLPDVEEGNLSFAGITTENPRFFIVGPLLSRSAVFRLNPLEKKDIIQILDRAVKDRKKGLGSKNLSLTSEAAEELARKSGGDARYALNILEICSESKNIKKNSVIERKDIESLVVEKKYRYDREGDEHYDTISAFIKSMRGSDPDAAVYYLSKMIKSGEDPRFIARRISICASEDVGNADPKALLVANAALNSVRYVGLPEAGIILSQAAVYISTAPKSNASYKALNKAMKVLDNESEFTIPAHLTKNDRENYLYPHDYISGYVKQKYMDKPRSFYHPSNRGYEKKINAYLKLIKGYKHEAET
ncbi:MAG: replication-associated recombination protein A, partial [Elusimicrobiota bacterium]